MTARRPKSSRTAALVWRVVDFQNRFELPDDIRIGRQGPLTYAKLYVSANDEASATYLKQIDRLTRRPDGMELEGGWVRILRAVSNHGNIYRGYLLNDRHAPASETEIAADVLYCDGETAMRILSGLAEVGLIEQVEEPDWNARAEAAKPAKPRAKSSKKPAGTKTTQKTKSGRGKSGFQNVRENSGTFGKKASPSRIKSEVEDQSRETKEEKKSKRSQTEGKARATELKNRPSPTTTPSVFPAKNDGGAGPRSRGRQARSPSIPTAGHVLKLSRFRYDAAAWAFADGVLLASGYRESDKARRECERSHWAKAWTDAAAEFSPDVLAGLKRRIIQAAAGIHGRRVNYRNPESYLLRAFQNDLKDARRGHREKGVG